MKFQYEISHSSVRISQLIFSKSHITHDKLPLMCQKYPKCSSSLLPLMLHLWVWYDRECDRNDIAIVLSFSLCRFYCFFLSLSLSYRFYLATHWFVQFIANVTVIVAVVFFGYFLLSLIRFHFVWKYDVYTNTLSPPLLRYLATWLTTQNATQK